MGRASACAAVLLLASAAPEATAGEREIRADLMAYFAEPSAEARARLAGRVAADPAFRREKLHGWLRGLPGHARAEGVPAELVADVGLGRSRRVALLLPRGYTPERSWPLIYALHFSGGNGPQFIARVQRMLGERAEDFVIAAPSDHRQTGLDAPPPFTADHPAILRAVRQSVRVDSDRQYALGYSLGGYAAWAVACLHADELAGAAPLAAAGGCLPAGEDGLWRALLPNLQGLPVLNVWGERDELELTGLDGQRLGTIAELNRRLVKWSKGLAPDIDHLGLPGRGHFDVAPPLDSLLRVLGGRRREPRQVEHRFRHLHQGRAHWLEAHTWTGPSWGAALPSAEPRPGESPAQALGREVEGLLGLLKGRVEGQTVTLETRHVGDLTVWFGEGLVDWSRPVQVLRDGRAVFEGRLQPDLRVALEEARRRQDFDRLRWAGLRIGAGGDAAVVTGDTPFPPLLP